MHRYLLVGVVALTAGCVSPSSWFHKITASIKTPSAEVKQIGDVAQPARVTTSTMKTDVPLPPGTKVTIEVPARANPKSGETPIPNPVLSSISDITSIVGPTSFQPPPPPSPSAIADGNLRIWFWVGLVLGLGCGLFGLVRGWNLVMYGGACVAGACAIGIFFQTSPWLFALVGVGVALKVAGPWIYHTTVKPLEDKLQQKTPP